MSRSLVSVLRQRASTRPDDKAFTFLLDGETEAESLTFGALDRRGRALGAALAERGYCGGRAILLYPPGLEFIASFCGCLYGGVIAVPAYPPRPRRGQARLRSIVADCRPQVVLTTSGLVKRAAEINAEVPELEGIEWVATDRIPDGPADSWRDPEIDEDALAFLQYTSGSTAAPKGVMVSHGNLLQNLEAIRRAFRQDETSVVVGWLPLFHDMGLIGNVLQVLYSGARGILMSPAAFLQKPSRWLQAISRYRATTSGGPNFAYDLCVRGIGGAQSSDLDLGCWSVAFNGSEPVRAATLSRFAAAFADSGFSASAFYPCYGLAEATLFAAGGVAGRKPRVESFGVDSLEQGLAAAVESENRKSRDLVSCGGTWTEHTVAIVDPATGKRCPEEKVGEIWIAGPSVAQGYWNRPDETASTFRASLAGDERLFLRTGDLGFEHRGELFVAGRFKDLIIIRGRNHYPQDIELTVERCHPGLRSGGGAAFSVEIDGEERLVVVQEVDRRHRTETEEISQAIRRAVTDEHEVWVYGLALLPPGALPKTSSGKVQRRACREAYVAGELPALADDSVSEPSRKRPDRAADFRPPDRDELLALAPAKRRAALISHLFARAAALAGISGAAIDPALPLTALGLDSLAAVELKAAVEGALQVEVSLGELLQGASVAELADGILEGLERQTAADIPAAPAVAAAQVPHTEAEPNEPYPLSIGQLALWHLEQLAREPGAYNVAVAGRTGDVLDGAALGRALARLVERHPALCTTFHVVDGEPVQRASDEPLLDLVEIDGSDWSDGRTADQLAEEALRPFDLRVGPPLRVRVYSRASGERWLLLVVHHLVADFWSLALLSRELGACLLEETGGPQANLPPPGPRFERFVTWQREMLAGPQGERLREYWSGRLRGLPAALDLPVDRPHPPLRSYRGGARHATLPRTLEDGARALGAAHGATLFAVLLAAWQAHLWRYTGTEDFAVGTPTAGRGAPGFEATVGYFVNPVVLRAATRGELAIGDLLRGTARTVAAALEHADLPFAVLAETLRPERDRARSPLFQTLFLLQSQRPADDAELPAFALGDEAARLDFGGFRLAALPIEARRSQFELSLRLASRPAAGLDAVVEYNSDLFDPATAGRILRHFETLLAALIERPTGRLSDLSLLAAAERHQLTAEWGEEQAGSGWAGTVVDLFEAQVELHPEVPAVLCEGQGLTFRELDRRADGMARALRAAGVGPESRVAVCARRSPALAAGLFAVLKSGGAYLPLDPGHPPARLAYLLADSGATVLLTERALAETFSDLPVRRVWLDPDDESGPAASVGRIAGRPERGHLAYLLYTSGTTGVPKAVLAEHGHLLDALAAAQLAFGFGTGDRMPSVAPFSFDISLFELLAPILAGGTSVLLPLVPALDLDLLLSELRAATRFHAVPAVLRQVVDRLDETRETLPGLRQIFVGGDLVPARLLADLRRLLPGCRVTILYGPTEASLFATAYPVPEEDEAPRVLIGRALEGRTIRLLDAAGEPVPIGVPGEIHLGGAGVTRGYLGRPDLTADRYLPTAGGRLYRTGDLGRFLPHGDLEFLGRTDRQVKVRGMRIELAEVESALTSHPGVRAAAVVVGDGAAGSSLLAYAVAEEGLGAEGLRLFLKERLPDYMVPATVVFLPELPVTAHGKVDRARLPAPPVVSTMGDETAPAAARSPVEEIVAGLWAEGLGRPVGIHDDVFALGGHSLLATRVVSRLREALGIEIPLSWCFDFPTVAGFAAAVSKRPAGASPPPPIAPRARRRADHQAPNEDLLPLSAAQERLWFADRLQSGGSAYNMLQAVAVSGPLDLDALAATFLEVYRRHEVLRTALIEHDGQPMQKVLPVPDRRLPSVDLRGLGSAASGAGRGAEVERLLGDEERRPFDLTRGRMLRALHLRLGESEHLLLVSLHHIAADGWSTGVLVEEVNTLFPGFARGEPERLPDLPIQYADFALWQREELRSERLAEQMSYWRERLREPPHLELPTDRPRPLVQSFRGGSLEFALEADLTARLARLSRRRGATLFMTLLAGFEILLVRHTGQEDLAVGTPVAGRNRVELERLIGCFVNDIVLRLDAGADPTCEQLLGRVRATTLGAYAHQDLPFDRLVAELVPDRNLAQSPLFQVVLALQNAPLAGMGDLVLGDAELRPLAVEGSSAKFDLVFAVAEVEGVLKGTARYRSDLFDAATVRRLTESFAIVLGALDEAPERRLWELPALSAAAAHQLLLEWNPAYLESPQEPAVHRLFETQVERAPEAFAASFGDRRFTYRELNARANQVAHALRDLGVGPEVRVGICMERSMEVVVALLGILKAGGAYLPLDPAYPKERLAFMIEDGRAEVLVSQRSLLGALPGHRLPMVLLDPEWWDGEGAGRSTANPRVPVAPENLAYVMYTSGSTGRPKGVSIQHRALAWFVATLSYGEPRPGERFAQGSTHSFDAATYELWGALVYGAELVGIPKEEMISPPELAARLERERIDVLYLTAALFGQAASQRPDAFRALRLLLVSGEVVGASAFRNVLANRPPKNLLHCFGPTETTVFSSWQRVDEVPEGTLVVSIGRPIDATQSYLLDRDFRPVPVGAFGELFIGGDGLARDYLNRPDLTAERFVPDPFCALSGRPGDRLYRTGDLVRYLPDGRMEFGSRIDTQVKIRGMRIELQEIEGRLTRHPAIREAVVLAREDSPGDKRLVAYVVAPGGLPATAELRAFLKEELPDYMVPAAYVSLPAIPLSNNGKVNRRSLPAPTVQARSAAVEALPTTPLELWLAERWRDALRVESVALDDNFFETGGNSLSGAVLVNRIQEELREIVHVVVIFDAPTVREMARHLVREHRDAVVRRWGAESAGAVAEGGATPGAGVGPAEIAEMRRLIAAAPPLGFDEKNPPAVFLLSPPRSGSTLLRVLLAGHPRLFAPPELELLSFATLDARKAAFPGRDSFWLEGAIRAVMEIHGCDADSAKEIVAGYERERQPVQRFYRLLQEWIGARTLVDKTPSYSLDLEVLRRAEAAFSEPRYVHLIRHPSAMIRSFEEARLDQLFFRHEHRFSRRQLAELIWRVSHENIVRFLGEVPAARHHAVHFEELVKEPDRVLRELCDFLGLDYAPEMADPYRDGRARMTDGLHQDSRMLGDVKFHGYARVEAGVAERWRDQAATVPLSEETRRLAGALGVEGFAGSDWLPIEAGFRTRVERLPLSYGQLRLWLVDQLDPGSAAYHLAATIRLEGALAVAPFAAGLGEVVGRHEALRTTFPVRDGEAVQVVTSSAAFELPLIDLCALAGSSSVEARRLALALGRHPFDLSRGPLFRAALLRLASEEHWCAATMHHIVSDGWSTRILVRELAAAYEAFRDRRLPALPDLPVQYGDYAVWQRRWFNSGAIQSELEHWRRRLEGLSAQLSLPTDRPRPAVQRPVGARRSFALASPSVSDLQGFARERGATLFMLLAAAFAALVARLSGQRDLAIGTPVAGRNRAEIEGLIGFFVNTLVLRADLSGEPGFGEFLTRMRATAIDALGHQELPFEKLVEELAPERSLAYSPLFQVMFAHQDGALWEAEAVTIPGLALRPLEIEAGVAKFDLSLFTGGAGPDLRATLEYNTDLFDAATAERWAGHLQNLLAAAVAAPERRLWELSLLSSVERQALAVEWADSYPPVGDGAWDELFGAQVRRTPDAIAVSWGDRSLTYRDLHERAARLARRLVRLGVGPDVVVGVYLGRSPDLVTALLGVLAAGGAYLPLDPAYPPERLAFMVEDAGAKVLLVEGGRTLPAANVVALDVSAEEAEEDAPADPGAAHFGADGFRAGENPAPIPPESLAYVIYTSGSTGLPKGVMVSRGGFASYLRWAAAAYGDRGPVTSPLHTSIGFDLTVTSLFVPLLGGERVVVIAEESSADGLADALRDARGDLLVKLTPAHLALLEAQLSGAALSWSGTFVIGGEALHRESLGWLRERAPRLRLINEYGPTETVVGCIVHEVTGDEPGAGPVPIGRPIAGTRAYALDPRFEPVPIGVVGELYLGGPAVARGYRSRPGLTAASFLPDAEGGGRGERLYRTGDLVRRLADGTFEFLGRGDEQVKVRGFRIEPAEIEAALCGHPRVREAAVIARRSPSGDAQLVAYVGIGADRDSLPSGEELRRYLLERLPAHLVPTAWVTMDSLPRTANAKVDRRALPAPGVDDGGSTLPAGAQTPTEELVAGLFARVLGRDRIQFGKSFFDLGGHSLSATQVLSRVRELWRIELPLRELFLAPTVSELARRIEQVVAEQEGPAAPPVGRAPRGAEPRLSFAQERLWFLDQFEPGSSVYTIAVALRLTGRLDSALLAACWCEVIRRHEVLRTRFEAGRGAPRPVVDSTISVRPLPLVDLDRLPTAAGESARLRRAEALRPFDLARGPLLRLCLLRLRRGEHLALLNLHHIVSDDWSNGVLVRELTVLYRAFGEGRPSPLPDLPIQYSDFAAWQRNWLIGAALEDQVGYWRRQLEDLRPRLALPFDRPLPLEGSSRGALRHIDLSSDLSAAVNALALRAGATSFMVLLAAFQLLLGRYSGEDDITVGSPIANRNRHELEDLIGFFVNTLVLRTRLQGVVAFVDLLARVRETALGAYAHQDVPFEKLVQELAPERDLRQSPFFQTLLILQNAPRETLRLPGLDLDFLDAVYEAAGFDLTLILESRGGVFAGVLEYNSDLFDPSTAERAVRHFERLLAGAVADPVRRIADLPLLSAAERGQIANEWNDAGSERNLRPVFEAQARGVAAHGAPGATAVGFRAHVLDREGGMVPVGVLGELQVSGVDVSGEALDDPAATALRFVPDPFAEAPGARLYRTGDLVRFHSDGGLEYVGRVDRRLTIRGVRIEPEEIEAVLLADPRIAEAAVVAQDFGAGTPRLIAYLVRTADQPLPLGELRRDLSARLPESMVPAALLVVDRLPKTANGKLDRRSLARRSLKEKETASSVGVPRTPTEEVVASIWSEMLGIERVGPEDNFFELGGHSLLATRLASRLSETFEVELPLRDLFEAPTVADLAMRLERSMRSGWSLSLPPIVAVPRSGALPLSFAQQRLWLADQIEPGSSAYNVSSAVRIVGPLDFSALARSFVALSERHEMLRTAFGATAGVPYQEIGPAIARALPVFDLRGLGEAGRLGESLRLLAAAARVSFDLRRGPLWRASIVRRTDDENLLSLTLHHIAADAWSTGIFIRESRAFYRAFVGGTEPALPVLAVQYADYAVWQRRMLTGETLETLIAYWKKQLAGLPAPLELPSDRPRPALPSYRGALVSSRLPAAPSAALRALGRSEGATLFMTLLAALQVLVERNTGRQDFVIGADIANRNRRETEPLIGFFINFLALRSSLGGDPSFRGLLGRVREATRAAYAHQDLPFERVVDALRGERAAGESSLLRLVLSVQNAPAAELQTEGLSFEPLALGPGSAKRDLTLFVREEAEEVGFGWSYSTDLFDRATIERMAGRFATLVSNIVGRPDAPLSSLEILSDEEKGKEMMDKVEHQKAKFAKLLSVKPKTMAASPENLVVAESFEPGSSLPLVIRPAAPGVDLVDWTRRHRDRVERDLNVHGAILFRGFEINSVAEFEAFAHEICSDLFGDYGDLPAERSGGKVYRSTPYPEEKTILFHNESSHQARWPMKQMFYCVQAARQGGETPIVDCRRIYRELDPALAALFERKGLVYERNFTDGLDVSWQAFFKTEDRAEVESRCRQTGVEWQWKESGLRTRQSCRAVARHPATGAKVFFNQVQLHHLSCLEPEVRASMLSVFDEADLPRNVYFGDGTPIDDGVIAEILALYWRAAVSFPWRERDIVLLDNMLTAHARNPFSGPRKIVVAMGQMIDGASLAD